MKANRVTIPIRPCQAKAGESCANLAVYQTDEEFEALSHVRRLGKKIVQLKRLVGQVSDQERQGMLTEMAQTRNCREEWRGWYEQANQAKMVCLGHTE